MLCTVNEMTYFHQSFATAICTCIDVVKLASLADHVATHWLARASTPTNWFTIISSAFYDQLFPIK